MVMASILILIRPFTLGNLKKDYSMDLVVKWMKKERLKCLDTGKTVLMQG